MTELKPVAACGVNNSVSLDQQTCLLHKTACLSPASVSTRPNPCVTEKLVCFIRGARAAPPTFAAASRPDPCFSKGRHVQGRPGRQRWGAFAGLGAKDRLGARGQNGREGSGTGACRFSARVGVRGGLVLSRR